MTKGDPKLSEGDIESARRMKENDNNNDIIQGSILVRFKNINQIFTCLTINDSC